MASGSSEFPDLPEPPPLTAHEESVLLEAAARAVRAFCRGLDEEDLGTLWSATGRGDARRGEDARAHGTGQSGLPEPAERPDADRPLPILPGLRQRCGVFVTLFQEDDLRGCLGLTQPSEPLHEAVPSMAHAASSRDTRFEPIEARDLPHLTVEVTFLGAMTRLPSSPAILLERLDPQVCGAYIRFRGRSGLLLPQVARRYSWTAGELLQQVCRKAGIPPDSWRLPDAEIFGFRARSTEPVRVLGLPGPAGPGAGR